MQLLEQIISLASVKNITFVVLGIIAAAGVLIAYPVIRVARQTIPYVYANVRVRMMEGRLIMGDNLEELTTAAGTGEVLAALDHTDYSDYLADIVLDRAISVEEAFNRHLVDTHWELVEMSPRRVREVFEIMAQRWDARNIKTVLMGVYAGKTTDEIMDEVMPVGELDKDDIKDLAESRSVSDMVVSLEGTVYSSLEEALPLFEETGTLTPLNAVLDKIVLEETWRRMGSVAKGEDLELLRTHLTKKIDVTNILTLLRGKREGIPFDEIEPFLVRGGTVLDGDINRAYEAEGVSGFIAEFEGTEYYRTLMDVFPEYEDTGSLMPFEHSLDTVIAQHCKDISTMNPLGLGPLISFMELKEVEARNLKVITRGKDVGMPTDQIKRLIINV